jgi:hypothetical protein
LGRFSSLHYLPDNENKERTMTLRILLLSATFLILAACGQKATEVAPEVVAVSLTASADGAELFFIAPADGAVVTNPISVEFGIAAMDVVKAGIDQPNSGHHHLLIDTGLPDLASPIPADEHHVHFGDGSTSTEISLPPGEHTLQMLLGDHRHIPHNPALVSEPITITVK